MPHRIAGRKLSRTHDHRMAMLGNLAVSVIRYERVKTTEAKAKEVRGLVDGMITLAKRGDLHARRQLVSRMPHEPLIVEKLMGEIASKYADRAQRLHAHHEARAASGGRRHDGPDRARLSTGRTGQQNTDTD